MVTRYYWTHDGMDDAPEGAWVHNDDYAALQAENERLKSEAGYTAADVATAAADGFRDGVRSVDLEKFRSVLEYAYIWGGNEVSSSLYDELSELIDAHKGE